MFNIVERFITISGEAPIMGEPVYLIRFTGCNLKCSYCDTTYNNEINEQLSYNELRDDIIKNANQFQDLKILFTGGEPLLGERQERLFSLMSDLKHINFYIETNGTIPIMNFNLPNCHFVADWKSPSACVSDEFCFANLKEYRIGLDCIKFVVAREDLDWLRNCLRIIEKINPFLSMYVSPQFGKIELSELADFILRNRLPLKMSLQLHKIIWSDKERGV